MNAYQNLVTDNQIALESSGVGDSLKEKFNCHWLAEPDSWNKEKFSREIVLFIEQTQGVNAFPNLILIGMLAQQIDIYVQCTRQIATGGLIEVYNKGATSGPSLYFSMSDKAINRIVQLMKELGLTPAHLVGQVRTDTKEALEFEEFMSGR